MSAAAALAGCSRDLSDIDARTQTLLLERERWIDGGTIAPSMQRGEPGAGDRARELSTRPATTNPEASAMRYEPADEARDVAARLAQFAADATGQASPGEVLGLDLEGVFRLSHRSAREYLNAEEDYILSAIRLLVERHRWGPRLFNDTTVELSGSGEDGDFDSAVRLVNELRATKRLPYGGEVEARWIWQATEQLRSRVSGQYEQSSEIALDASIPLLRGAGMVAREDLIQAERDLIYAARAFEDFRRNFLVSLAGDYFDLLQAQSQIANAERSLAGLRNQLASDTAKAESGRIAEFQRNISANRVLQGEADLASQRERYILLLDRFKIRLGLPVETPIDILPLDFRLDEPLVSLDEATRLALEFRLDLQNSRDRVDDARRRVANARNNARADLDLTAGVSIPTDADTREGGVAFDPDDTRYNAGIRLGMPLDRRIERLQIRQAVIQLQQAERDYEQFRDEVSLAVRQAVRNIDLARFQLRLAEERVEINRRRVMELELKSDEVDSQSRVDAQNELLDAENARDQAVTDLRNAVLAYLRESGQLRVARDGTFEWLPGMERLAPGDEPAGDVPPAEPGPEAPPPSPPPEPPGGDAPEPADPARGTP